MRDGLRVRWLPWGLALVIVTFAPPLAADAGPDALPCPGFEHVAFQGPSCPVAGGWEVILADGKRLLTHGPDPVPQEPSGDAPGSHLQDLVIKGPFAVPRDPACISTNADHQNYVVYAHPANMESRYDLVAPLLRETIRIANGVLHAEGEATGGGVDYRFRCDGATIRIDDVRLPNVQSGAASFSAIVNDLRAAGYESPYAKYWVWYDGHVSGIGGQANIRNDDRPILENRNNEGPSYALTYGYMSVRILMHENGHNLGAVQLSAPHSTGGWHCTDGYDIMCYNDGGPNGGGYSTSHCPTLSPLVQPFDCNKDDYFHRDPPAGSYLDTHWNLGSPLNRFLHFH